MCLSLTEFSFDVFALKIISLTETSLSFVETRTPLTEIAERHTKAPRKKRKLDRYSSLTNYRGTHVHPFAYSVINLQICFEIILIVWLVRIPSPTVRRKNGDTLIQFSRSYELDLNINFHIHILAYFRWKWVRDGVVVALRLIDEVLVRKGKCVVGDLYCLINKKAVKLLICLVKVVIKISLLCNKNW